MFPRWCYLPFFILLVMGLSVVNAQTYVQVGHQILPCSTIVVDQSGHGNFTTIQSAIDSVPHNNKDWVAIEVKAGIYREKVKIPEDKPYMILKGQGKRKTLVEWADHKDIVESPTFESMAHNIVVKFMSFRNPYSNPSTNEYKNATQAVAAKISGDKSYFLRVGFYGLQDTLWDDHGRHFYRQCTIQGAVDFIFGAGQSLFERCTISVNGDKLDPHLLPGYITAQGREHSNDRNGFVFKDCEVTGKGATYLGRPWREYARVLFYNTNMSSIVHPSGWQPWDYSGHEDGITFAEYGSFGPGGFDTSKRVEWSKTNLDLATVNSLATRNFIDLHEWSRNLRF